MKLKCEVGVRVCILPKGGQNFSHVDCIYPTKTFVKILIVVEFFVYGVFMAFDVGIERFLYNYFLMNTKLV